ncbi:MAG: hypothetical protein MH137_03340 [Flavobacteriales bacterium]|nr:hypothetical protein [Flavobacteriales bacterium]
MKKAIIVLTVILAYQLGYGQLNIKVGLKEINITVPASCKYKKTMGGIETGTSVECYVWKDAEFLYYTHVEISNKVANLCMEYKIPLEIIDNSTFEISQNTNKNTSPDNFYYAYFQTIDWQKFEQVKWFANLDKESRSEWSNLHIGFQTKEDAEKFKAGFPFKEEE